LNKNNIEENNIEEKQYRIKRKEAEG